MKDLVHGVGINDSGHGNVYRCAYYSVWISMLKRCYSRKLQDKYPTYIDCTVCKEWLTFSNFKKWMELQDWQGKELDKDLLVSGNKIYSPDTCIFVTSDINKLLINSKASRGAWPVGVDFSIRSNKFRSRCSSKGLSKHLGLFDTPMKAHAAWQNFKIKCILEAAENSNDKKISSCLIRIAEKINKDLKSEAETLNY